MPASQVSTGAAELRLSAEPHRERELVQVDAEAARSATRARSWFSSRMP